jgi:hypothetical protein
LSTFPALLLGHGARRTPGLSSRQVDEFDHVLADEILNLRSPDRPPQRALDHHQRPLAERLAEVLKEPVGVRCLEVL